MRLKARAWWRLHRGQRWLEALIWLDRMDGVVTCAVVASAVCAGMVHGDAEAEAIEADADCSSCSSHAGD